ncbi:MAG: penicillin-binding protein, partial [Myxococcales bacterium]|nr:penicillin-binding protein [Myxococcales bacterium]
AAVKLGGKTGTLALRDPYTSYTWFVGFAPLDDPQIAIAVMVGNGELWWQRAIDIARDTLAEYFQKKAEKTVAAR